MLSSTRHLSTASLLWLGLSFSAPAQQQIQGPLDDQRIMQLAQSGIHSDELERLIASAPEVNFLMNPSSTDVMLKAGVSENVLRAMSARENGAPFRERPSEPIGKITAVDGRPRVYVEGTPNSWSFDSGSHGGGGSHPQLAEVMKTLGHSCPGLIVTNDPKQAQYSVTFERESKKVLRKDNKIAVFNRSGDMVFSSSTRALGNGIRGFCSSLR
jgi:hypothetical protein